MVNFRAELTEQGRKVPASEEFSPEAQFWKSRRVFFPAALWSRAEKTPTMAKKLD